MFKILLFSAFLGLASASFIHLKSPMPREIIDPFNCAEENGFGELLAIRFGDCTLQPCSVNLGDRVTFEYDFKTGPLPTSSFILRFYTSREELINTIIEGHDFQPSSEYTLSFDLTASESWDSIVGMLFTAELSRPNDGGIEICAGFRIALDRKSGNPKIEKKHQ